MKVRGRPKCETGGRVEALGSGSSFRVILRTPATSVVITHRPGVLAAGSVRVKRMRFGAGSSASAARRVSELPNIKSSGVSPVMWM